MAKKRKGIRAPKKALPALLAAAGMSGAVADEDKDKKKRDDSELAERWLKIIKKRWSDDKKWREQARLVVERYRDERDTVSENESHFNILYANTETLKPSIFSRMPVPDVRRRYLDADRTGRIAAQILQRSLQFCIEYPEFKDTLDRDLEDYLLPGRGQAWIKYTPTIEVEQERVPASPLPAEDGRDIDQDQADESDELAQGETLRETIARNLEGPVAPDQQALYAEGTQFDDQGAYTTQTKERVIYEELTLEYVAWDMFLMHDCPTWKTCQWVGRGNAMRKDEVAKKYGEEIAEELSYTWKPTEDKYKDTPKDQNCALLWDIWHKPSRKMMVFAEGYSTAPIEIVDDPLQLEGFFPCPEPIYSIRNNKSWLPRPEFLLYQDQANELDEVSNRLKNLTNALKVRGVYDQAMDEVAKISDLVKKPDLTLIPIPDFRTLMDKGGLGALLSFIPLEEIALVIIKLTERQGELKQIIYELTGISDIIRGATKASETLGAQKLKAAYVNLRVGTRGERFQIFIRDSLRIMAEIIAEHFSPQTIKIMTGQLVLPDAAFDQAKQAQQLPPNAISESDYAKALATLKQDKLRGFKVSIETDSTLPVDRENEQNNRIEFISAVSSYLEKSLPAVQSGMLPAKIAREFLMFGVRGFKVGGELEDMLDSLGDQTSEQGMQQQLVKMGEQMKQMQGENQQLQDENAKMKAELPAKMMAHQMDAALEKYKSELKTFTEILIAEINKATSVTQQQAVAAKEAATGQPVQNAAPAAPAAPDAHTAALLATTAALHHIVSNAPQQQPLSAEHLAALHAHTAALTHLVRQSGPKSKTGTVRFNPDGSAAINMQEQAPAGAPLS